MFRLVIAWTLMAPLAALAATWHGHGEDFVIGVDENTNALQVEYDPLLFPYPLPPSDDPLLAGWTLDDPGLIALDAPDPHDPSFVPVDPDADIAFELIAVSRPEFKVWNPLGPGEPGFQILPGEVYNFPGVGEFHAHVWWHIDAADPSYDPNVSAWEVTFRFVDLRTAGAHGPSDPVTVAFTPEPGTLIPLLAAVLALRCRANQRIGAHALACTPRNVPACRRRHREFNQEEVP